MIIVCQWRWVPHASPCGAPARWLIMRGALPWYACGRHLNPTCESLTSGDAISLTINRLAQVNHPALAAPPGMTREEATALSASREEYSRGGVARQLGAAPIVRLMARKRVVGTAE